MTMAKSCRELASHAVMMRLRVGVRVQLAGHSLQLATRQHSHERTGPIGLRPGRDLEPPAPSSSGFNMKHQAFEVFLYIPKALRKEPQFSLYRVLMGLDLHN